MIKVPDGVLHATACLEEAREVVMAVAMIRVALKRLLIRRDGLVGAILILKHYA
jgi:hypothetical protein